ncbi:MAG: hypothetical protein KF865_01530 [Bdellovibrionaceae bacterium]|nr:hypothetical protein [Pseudobdellovibrionaceae bacterium]
METELFLFAPLCSLGRAAGSLRAPRPAFVPSVTKINTAVTLKSNHCRPGRGPALAIPSNANEVNVKGTLLMLAFLLSAPAHASIEFCLNRAGLAADPLQRDQARMACLRHHRARLSFGSCLKIVKGLEYSIHSEEMRSYCLFQKNALKPSQCARAARSMEYGSNRDALLWSCLKRLNLTIERQECLQLGDLMTFSFNKNRASSYCLEEIRSVR